MGRGVSGQRQAASRPAGYDGYFPANLEHPDQLAEIVATITQLCQHTTAGYDIAVGLPIGVDPLPYIEAGATWWMPEFPPEWYLWTRCGVCSAMARWHRDRGELRRR